MSYIKIEREKLVNLKYALDKELIRANTTGSYASTTVVGCNTRKYHGLLVSPLPDRTKHVLLSEVEEIIDQHDESFRMGIRRYKGGKYHPHGNRYIREFETEPIPSRTYRVGGVVFKKEILLVQNEDRILIRYTIIQAKSATKLKLKPFLAFRSIHSLTHANMDANTKVSEIQNGIKIKLYEGYPFLHMQVSRANKFVTAPDWFKDIEYEKEAQRGYEAVEDLFVPGYFDIKVKEGDVVIFSAGLDEVNTKTLTRKFNSEIKIRTPRSNFENNLKNAASQFFTITKTETRINAGFHWYGFQFREAIISLIGLTLGAGKPELFRPALDTIIKKLQKKENVSIEIPLLLIRVIQQYFEYEDVDEATKKKYLKEVNLYIKQIKEGFYNTYLHDNGFIYIPKENTDATWMNECNNGKLVVERYGYAVEIIALWYNALNFSLEFKNSKQNTEIVSKIKNIFEDMFWNEEFKALFDFIADYRNRDTRSNQIFAISLPYSPLSESKKRIIFRTINRDLLIKKGVRTLSPKNQNYDGFYKGNESERKLAKHQGVAHPWILGQYCDAFINIFGKSSMTNLEEIFENFEEEQSKHGLGTISEVYDANPPYSGRGAISYAPSVGELLRIKMIIDKNKK